MKNVSKILLGSVLVLSLAGCGGVPEKVNSDKKPEVSSRDTAYYAPADMVDATDFDESKVSDGGTINESIIETLSEGNLSSVTNSYIIGATGKELSEGLSHHAVGTGSRVSSYSEDNTFSVTILELDNKEATPEERHKLVVGAVSSSSFEASAKEYNLESVTGLTYTLKQGICENQKVVVHYAEGEGMTVPDAVSLVYSDGTRVAIVSYSRETSLDTIAKMKENGLPIYNIWE